ncbi:MAG: alpha/beta fold hydrolase [Burkholderiaceae bacterium]
MREVALSLGPGQNLVSVLTEPSQPRKSVAVILLNAGVVHRIGPHRIGVKLARHLANRGYTVVRFDASGVGDSRPSRDSASFKEQATLDVRAVMDYVQREHGLNSVALFGICAGAANAYQAALVDDRVTGLFMLDGYSFPTLKSRWIQYVVRVRKIAPMRLPVTALRHARHAFSAIWRRSEEADDAAPVAEAPSQPTREQFARGVQTLVDRGVRLAALYSGSVFSEYVYPQQMRDAFKSYRFVKQIICYYEPGIDHLVTPLVAQRRLVEIIGDWLSSVGPSGS